MYLKRIELYGFKSFAEKIELEFKNGITAIVGPNGSGKSNIADAVRWVLGEQSIKSLRGSKMEDVIFAGTQRRKPLGYAEVSLILDNSSGDLPIDYSEVRVTRRVFRSGESEFYINKASCRLKDIHQLFMDTGLGKEGYSIIGQGRIDDILSVNSQDRRFIFEEAAGIVKHKTRKNEAEKKLEKTQQNLIRIVDITNELENQIDPLYTQAEKAKEYLSIKENLKNRELALFLHKMDELKEKHLNITTNKDNITTEIEEKERSILEIDNDNNRLKKYMEDIEEQIDENQKRLYDIKSAIEKNDSEIQLYNERIDNLTDNKDRLNIEVIESKELIISLLEDKKSKENELNILSKRIDSKMLELGNLKHRQSDIRDLQQVKEKNIEDKRQLKMNQLNRLSELKSNLNGVQIMINNINKQLVYLHNNEEKILENIKHLIDKKQENLIAMQGKNKDTEELHKKKKTLKEKLLELGQQAERLKDLIANRINELNVIQSKSKILQEMEMDYGGYYKSVKHLMSERRKNSHLQQNIHGVIAELIKVPSEFTVAIEKALGSSLQNIVVKDEFIAKECINILNKKKWGRATFLPLDVIKGNKISRDIDILESDSGFLGIASDLVEYQATYRNIMEQLLGRVAIVKDTNAGIHLSRKLKHRIKIVTKDGVVFNPGGSIVGGSSNSSNNNDILSRQHEIVNLTKLNKKLNEDINNLNSQLLSVEAMKEDLQNQYNSIIDTINIYEKELISINNVHDQLILEEKRLNTELAQMQNDINTLKNELIELQYKYTEIEQKIAESENQLSNLDKEIMQNNDINQDDKEELEKLIDTATKLEIEIAKSQQKQLDIENQLEQTRNNIDESYEKINTKNEILNNYELQILEHNRKISELEKSITILQESKRRIELEHTDILQKREELKEQIQMLEEHLKEYNKQLVITNNALHKLEIQLSKVEMEMENMQSRVYDEYQMTYNLALGYKRDIPSVQKINQEIKNLKDQIKNLGNVNLNSIEEYKRVSERYKFLSKQREDLETAKESLHEIIREIIKTMEKQFIEHFSIIKEEFNNVFESLFQGGYGKVYLTDPENPLTSGVEIEVQPPGKKLQNLSLLSGGERALTAIALLFAILKVKPTPFCILDEIEAALDDPNVYRYANYLKDFSKDTQFIAVTHRKGTMESADILYGITMEEQGVSKLVSVKLTELVS